VFVQVHKDIYERRNQFHIGEGYSTSSRYFFMDFLRMNL
jgi:hypothetical protein